MSGNWVIRHDVSCDTLTVDVSAALGGDRLSWPHSQMPSSLKTQAAAHNNLLFSLWQATAPKALLEVGENNAWWWHVLTPQQELQFHSPAHPVPALPRLGCPAWSAWSPEGMLQCLLVQLWDTSATASSGLPGSGTSKGFAQSSLHTQAPARGA